MVRQAKDQTFYEQVVAATSPYLGPAAGRFIDRQVQNHLHKEPAALLPSDMAKLIDWIRIAVSFLSEDSSVVEEYIGRLSALTARNQASEV
jgi:hypothetical protein